MVSITNPHDLFFKEVESRRENVIDLIQGTCPPDLVNNLDFSTLSPDKTSYTTEELKEYFSDLVYNCQYRGKYPIKVSLLFEHKSYKPAYPHIQVLRYMLNIWDTQIKKQQSLTPVIPVVFYHGKEKWDMRPFPDYFKGLDAFLEQYIPSFHMVLTDTSRYPDNEIRDTLFAREANKILFLLMKYIFNTGYLKDHLKDILETGREFLKSREGLEFFKSILVYLFTTTEFTVDYIVNIADTISKEGGELAMTTAMKLKEEGKIEGILGLYEAGVKINVIARGMKMSVEEVKKILTDHGMIKDE
jgi:predicted transposase/invertase (TIGR01784 family)